MEISSVRTLQPQAGAVKKKDESAAEKELVKAETKKAEPEPVASPFQRGSISIVA